MKVFVALLLVTAVVGYGAGRTGCVGSCGGPAIGGGVHVATHQSQSPSGANRRVASVSPSGGYWWQSNNPFVGAGSRAPSTGGGAAAGSRPLPGHSKFPSAGQVVSSGGQQPFQQPFQQQPAGNIVGPMGICPVDYVCVHWQLCRKGNVIVDGTGIIDKSKRRPVGQNTLQSCGDDMVCCGVAPGYTVPGVISTLTAQQSGSSELLQENVDFALRQSTHPVPVGTLSVNEQQLPSSSASASLPVHREQQLPSSSGIASLPVHSEQQHLPSFSSGASLPVHSEQQHLPSSSAGASLPVHSEQQHLPSFSSGASLPVHSEQQHLPSSSAGASLPVHSEQQHLPSFSSGASLPVHSEQQHLPSFSSGASLPVHSEQQHLPSSSAGASLPVHSEQQLPSSSAGASLPVHSEQQHLPSSSAGASLSVHSEQQLPSSSAGASLPVHSEQQHLPSSSSGTSLPIHSEQQHLPSSSASASLPVHSEQQHLPSSSAGASLPVHSEQQHLPSSSAGASLPVRSEQQHLSSSSSGASLPDISAPHDAFSTHSSKSDSLNAPTLHAGSLTRDQQLTEQANQSFKISGSQSSSITSFFDSSHSSDSSGSLGLSDSTLNTNEGFSSHSIKSSQGLETQSLPVSPLGSNVPASSKFDSSTHISSSLTLPVSSSVNASPASQKGQSFSSLSSQNLPASSLNSNDQPFSQANNHNTHSTSQNLPVVSRVSNTGSSLSGLYELPNVESQSDFVITGSRTDTGISSPHTSVISSLPDKDKFDTLSLSTKDDSKLHPSKPHIGSSESDDKPTVFKETTSVGEPSLIYITPSKDFEGTRSPTASSEHLADFQGSPGEKEHVNSFSSHSDQVSHESEQTLPEIESSPVAKPLLISGTSSLDKPIQNAGNERFHVSVHADFSKLSIETGKRDEPHSDNIGSLGVPTLETGYLPPFRDSASKGSAQPHKPNLVNQGHLISSLATAFNHSTKHVDVTASQGSFSTDISDNLPTNNFDAADSFNHPENVSPSGGFISGVAPVDVRKPGQNGNIPITNNFGSSIHPTQPIGTGGSHTGHSTKPFQKPSCAGASPSGCGLPGPAPTSGGSFSSAGSPGGVHQPGSSGSFSQPGSSGSFSQPGSSGSFSQPGSSGSFSQPGSSGSFSRPGSPSGGSYNEPGSGGSFTQPGGNAGSHSVGGFQQPGTSGSFSDALGSASSPGSSFPHSATGGSFQKPGSSGSFTQTGSSGSFTQTGSSGSLSKPGFGGSFTHSTGSTGSLSGGYQQPGSGSGFNQPGSGGSFTHSTGSTGSINGGHRQPGSAGSFTQPGGSAGLQTGGYQQPGFGGGLSQPGSGGGLIQPGSGGSFSPPGGSAGTLSGSHQQPGFSGGYQPGGSKLPKPGTGGNLNQLGGSVGSPGGSYPQPSGGFGVNQLTTGSSSSQSFPQQNPPSMASMMGGMMGMNGSPLIAGTCSAGTYCIPRFQCNPYNGFIIMDPNALQAVWPDAPQVPLLDCFIPAGVLDNGVCCQQNHPIVGPNGQVLD